MCKKLILLLCLCLCCLSVETVFACHPTLKCVEQKDQDTLVGYFGFVGGETISIGPRNKFFSGDANRGQGTYFKAISGDDKFGSNSSVPGQTLLPVEFGVNDSLSWKLSSTTVTASKKSKNCGGSCVAILSAKFSDGGKTVVIESTKDISHAVFNFCDGKSQKVDNLKGLSLEFKHSKCVKSVVIKSGCSSLEVFNKIPCVCFTPTPTATPTPTPTATPTPTPTATPTPTPTATPTPTPTATPTPTPTPVLDCGGVPGGQAKVDECGVCGGDSSTCSDCLGVPNGDAKLDFCGICDADPSNDNLTCNGCDGVPNSGRLVDECGVCGGDNSSCLDCAGIPNGGGSFDACGVCNGQSNTCLDCEGTPNGGVLVDACGMCDGNGDCRDCLGIPNGPNKPDACGVCNGSNACLDCAGIPNGGTLVDECGICGGDGKSCKKCPFRKVPVNKGDLLSKIKYMFGEKTVKYYKEAAVCDPYNWQLKSKSRINSASLVLREYIRIVNKIPNKMRICKGECVKLKIQKKLRRLQKLNRELYKYASESQYGARAACKKTSPGVVGTKPISNGINKDILSCPTKVCA